MEKTMKVDAFEELNEQEMQEVDGGIGFWAGLVIGFVVDGIVIATTGKSCGEWTAIGIKAGANWVRSTFGW